MGRPTKNWAWLTFFAIQIPLLALEGLGKKLLKQQHWHVPRLISIIATQAVLLWLADAFFFPPCLDTGLADRVVDAIKGHVNQLVAFFN